MGQSDLRASGERIEHLLEASAAAGPVARDRAEELVRLVVELYGSGLERLLEVLHEAGALTEHVLERLADDDLVASLMLVHGLHPYDVEERVERALAGVRPYLGSHGGNVELVGVDPEGVVRLRMLGSCDGCPSSSATLTLAVEGAIEAAAPEVTRIDVETPTAAPATPKVIPVDALSARLRPTPAWTPVPDLEDLPAGGVRCLTVGEVGIFVGRIGDTLYAYRDGCPACASSFAGSVIERSLAGGGGILTCPACRHHYDVQHAGRGLDDPDRSLDPLPLLERPGAVEVAVPTPVPA